MRTKKIPEKPRNTVVAEVSGLISGMPTSFAKAQEALDDIKRRASLATDTTGILTQGQATRLAELGQELTAILDTLLFLRRDIDGIIAAGIDKPEEAIDLF